MNQLESAVSEVIQQFEKNVEELVAAQDFAKYNHKVQVLDNVLALAVDKANFSILYDKIGSLITGGIFEDTPWAHPQRLSAALVAGTLQSDDKPSVAIEMLSELRILAIAEGKYSHTKFTQQEAKDFLKRCLVHNLNFLFPVENEFSRTYPEKIKRGHNLFAFITDFVSKDLLKQPLLEELKNVSAQRPIVVDRAIEIIEHIHQNFELANSRIDMQLKKYVKAHYGLDEPMFRDKPIEVYEEFLTTASKEQMRAHAELFAQNMADTGIVSIYHTYLVREIERREVDLLPIALKLSPTGRENLKKHLPFVRRLIKLVVYAETRQSVYGLNRILNRGLLARQPVVSGLERVIGIKLHPFVEKRLLAGFKFSKFYREGVISAKNLLLADTILVLGLPLGIGQGLNPTCQTARGISLWSQHAPGKLLNYIISAALNDNIEMRFEGKLIQANFLEKGLVKNLDLKLDSVSLVLVPHIDRIYNHLMGLVALRGADPHKWVNPALYGQWIPIGFAYAFEPLSQAIVNYEEFVRNFYSTHHPDYNGGLNLVYPNPVGIFITTSSANLLGFHAVSLQRIDKDPEGKVRAYFFNPNNEGRQDWGQGIKPSVSGNGEIEGESSVYFHEFVSRLYAYHYHKRANNEEVEIPTETIANIKKMAQESWGKEYRWL
ncbi:MAG: hypothetical protein JJT94_05575 [Bernardetiaceae bacterium]|nr:hypothetical protein [Bernardetiaceae bacterium]